MEDESKIFAAWLKRYIKIDKGIKQTALGDLIGKHQTSISSYINNKTNIDFATRQAIVKVTGIDYDKIMEAGRKELNIPEPIPSSSTSTPNDLQQKKNDRHHQIIDQFQNHEIAIEINQILVEIERIEKEELIEVKEMMQVKLNGLKRKYKIQSQLKTGTREKNG